MRQKLEMYAAGLKALVMGANLRSLTEIANPFLFTYYASENLFIYKSLFNKGLPAKRISDVFGDGNGNIQDITLAFPSDGGWGFGAIGSFTADIVNLCLLVKTLKPANIFEIGTFHGYGALHLALNAPQANVFTLDLPKGVMPALDRTSVDDVHIKLADRGRPPLLANYEAGQRVACLKGDSAPFDYCPYHGKVDLFFIDGAHSYAYVRNDTMKALECCHPGSVIAWHDYGRAGVNGVSKWLHEFAQDRNVYRVPGGSLAYSIV